MELDRLWTREMPTGVYDPRWLRCQTPAGEVMALAFTLSRRSPNYTGRIDDHEMLRILRHAQGRYGSTLDYLVRTAETLRQHRMCDRESERLLASGPARRPGLTPTAAPPLRAPSGCRNSGAPARALDRRQVVLGVHIDQHTRVVQFQPMCRVARHQAARAFITGQLHQLGEQLGAKAHRVSAPAAVLGEHHRMLAQRLGDLLEGGRLHQRHVARQHQPAATVGPRRHAGSDGETHAQRAAARAAHLGQHHHITPRHPTRRFSGQRLRW